MYGKEPYNETSSEANKFCQSLRPFSLYIVFPALYCVINYGVRFLVSQNTYQKLKGPQR